MPKINNYSLKLSVKSNVGPKLKAFLKNVDDGGKSSRQMLCKRAERALLTKQGQNDIDEFTVQYFSVLNTDTLNDDETTPDFTYNACINRSRYPNFASYCDGYTAKSYAVLALFAYLCEDKDMLNKCKIKTTDNGSDSNNTTQPSKALDNESNKNMQDNVIEKNTTSNTNDSVIDDDENEDEDEGLIHAWVGANTGNEEIDDL